MKNLCHHQTNHHSLHTNALCLVSTVCLSIVSQDGEQRTVEIAIIKCPSCLLCLSCNSTVCNQRVQQINWFSDSDNFQFIFCETSVSLELSFIWNLLSQFHHASTYQHYLFLLKISSNILDKNYIQKQVHFIDLFFPTLFFLLLHSSCCCSYLQF